MFLHTVNVIGQPPRPIVSADFSQINFGKIPQSLNDDLGIFHNVIKFYEFL